jgi:hypothetical protein
VNAVYCQRPNGAHKLAWLTAGDDGSLRVVAKMIALHGDGIETIERTFSPEDVADVDALSINVSCPCGDVYSLNLSAMFEGSPDLTKVRPLRDDTGELLEKWRRRAR